MDFDTALEAAQTCEPVARHVQTYDIEAIAQKHLDNGNNETNVLSTL